MEFLKRFAHLMEADTGANVGNNAEASQSGDLAAEQSADNAQRDNSLTQADVNRIVAKRLSEEKAKWAQDLEREKSEAARLAKLSAEERAKAEFEKEKKRFDEDKAKFESERMELETTKMLAAEKLPVEFAGILKGKTAEETTTNVETFKKSFQAAVETAVKERLRGNAAPASGGTGKTMNGVEEAFAKLNPKLKF